MTPSSKGAETASKVLRGRQPQSATLVIFGAGGDLTKRLVVPALYHLAQAGKLPDQFAIIGVDHNDQTTEQWRQSLTNMMQTLTPAGRIEAPAWSWLTDRMHYMPADFTQSETFRHLDGLLAKQREQNNIANVLFYLAVGERFFGRIVEQLGHAGLTQQSEEAWRRVIIEKPFGHDLSSAKALNAQILTVLSENQIYRIDHFLGKETVQNILVLRFANGIFEPLWNRDHIDHVQITATETIGVEGRGRFYEQTGALRDMVPNHLFQLLAMIGMEPPISFDADAVRTKKTELLQAIHSISPENAVRGQYGSGVVLGQKVQGYRQEPNVAPDSGIETYVALKLGIDNWRWAGVPFYLRTGKRLSARTTEIAIQFRQAPYALFRDTPVERLPANILMLRIQPDEGLSVSFSAKRPGSEIEIDGVAMDFAYRDYFKPVATVGYETLIYDCLIGDATLFQRADTVEEAWRAVQNLLDFWARNRPDNFPNYAAGSAGPDVADRLLARDGRAWMAIRTDHAHKALRPEVLTDHGQGDRMRPTETLPPSSERVSAVKAAMRQNRAAARSSVKNVLVVDVGGTSVKILATGQDEHRSFLSGPTLTPTQMVSEVRKLSADWTYNAVSIGFPGPVLCGRPIAEPYNLGSGWVGFNFGAAFSRPVRVINDAAMQAMGSYKGGKMLFLGLGTGLGSTMIVDGIVEPMELGHLPYKKGTYEDYIGKAGLERRGKKKWRRDVADVAGRLIAALEPDDTVLGGGNVHKLKVLPPHCRAGENDNAFRGGFRLWE